VHERGKTPVHRASTAARGIDIAGETPEPIRYTFSRLSFANMDLDHREHDWPRRRARSRLAVCVVLAAVAGPSGCGGRVHAPRPDPMAEPGLIPLPVAPPAWDVFPNPERGFYRSADLLKESSLAWVNESGATLVHAPIRLDPYRGTPLPPAFLAELEAAFDRVRDAGLKVIPRFMYNFGPYPRSEPDASEARIVSHLGQLAPVLAANADVLLVLQAGFIGAWGEWHSSTHRLDRDPRAKRRILDALLTAVPPDRMVALRFPTDIDDLVGPLPADRALTAEPVARVGSHQDCFLGSDSDVGTWGRTGNNVETDKDRMAQRARFVAVGGETCSPGPRANCWFASEEMRRMHWTYLNEDFHPDVIARFRAEGCFLDFQIRLGYRFVLERAAYRVHGDYLRLVARFKNEGYAALFNPRPIVVVLEGGGRRVELPMRSDPRRWRSLETSLIAEDLRLPHDLPAGVYRLSLWLPDPSPRLRNRPEYAIRLANQGVWDGRRGLNHIAEDVVIARDVAGGPLPLVVAEFGGRWPGPNDLGGWMAANGFVNGGQGEGEASHGRLILEYNGGGWFGTSLPTDVASYRWLVLRMRGAAGGEQRHVRVKLGRIERPLSSLTTDAVTTAWGDVRIDLRAAGGIGPAVEKLELEFWGSNSGRLEIGRIAFQR
jgi:hypothetical protein